MSGEIASGTTSWFNQVKGFLLLLALLTCTGLTAAQEPPPHPLQEEGDLHNSTILPRANKSARLKLAGLQQALKKKSWAKAARLIVRLADEEITTLVPVDDRYALGLHQYLAHQLAISPPELQQAVTALYQGSWKPAFSPNLTSIPRLTTITWSHPFHPPCQTALLRLADLFLEQGLDQRTHSVLRRLSLLKGSNALPTATRDLRTKTAKRIAALCPPAWTSPVQAIARQLQPTPLEWVIRDSDRATTEKRRREKHLRRGHILPRGNMVLCAGQACLHTGTHLWRINPETGKRLEPPIRLTAFSRHLPRSLAAHDDQLALIVGPRPAPGDLPGDHQLICLALPANGTVPGSPTWKHPGRLKCALPDNLRAEDARVLATGPISFGRGPVWIEGDLLVVIYVPLDKTRISCFLARLDGTNGNVRWLRFLAQGAPEAMDPRLNRLADMPFPHFTGCPIALYQGTAFVATELGTVQAIDAWQGRHLWAFRLARSFPEPGQEMGFLQSRLIATPGRLVATLGEAEWLYQFRPFPPPGGSPLLAPPLPRRGLSLLLGVQGSKAYFTANLDGEYCLERITLPTGSSYQSPPLQSGEYFTGTPLLTGDLILFSTLRRGRHGKDPVDGSLYRVDLKRDLYLELDYRPGQHFSLLGPLLPWKSGLISAGWEGFGLWRPAVK